MKLRETYIIFTIVPIERHKYAASCLMYTLSCSYSHARRHYLNKNHNVRKSLFNGKTELRDFAPIGVLEQWSIGVMVLED